MRLYCKKADNYSHFQSEYAPNYQAARRRGISYQETSEMNDERHLEREILASFERGEWKPVRNQKGEITRLKAAAETTLLKNKRVNIRISSRDLEGLQARAAEEGVPYQ